MRFLKAASLASALSLDANEIAFLAYDPARAVATSAKDKTVAGPATFHPASMANIAVGSRLAIDAGAAQEIVEVTAVTATSFTALTTQAHDGSASPFPIVSAPSPDVGRGWLNLLPGSPYRRSARRGYPGGADGARLRATLQAVLDFARLKKALSPSDERLLQTLRRRARSWPTGRPRSPASPVGARLAQCAADAVHRLDLARRARDIETFARVFDALAIVAACRVSAARCSGR